MSTKVQDHSDRSNRNPELSFSDLARIALENKTILLTAVSIPFLLALVYLKFATYYYSAEIRLTPVQQSSQGLDSQIAGLASMAGISLSQDQSVQPFTLFIEGVQSRQTALELSQNQAIMQTLFANQWNAEQQAWVEPSGILYFTAKIVKAILGSGSLEWNPPGAAELEEYLRKNVRVEQRPGEPIASIRFSHPDPEFALVFLDKTQTAADEFLRRRTLIRADQYILYLTKQMETVTVAEHRLAAAMAFSEQEKLRMMANSGLPFAAEPFGPIAVSSRPTSPAPMVVLLASIMFGFLTGVGFIALKRLARSNEPS